MPVAAQADDSHWHSAGAVARHALLRALRAQGLHPVPWARRAAVKDYFLNYRETTSNDFVLRQGGEDVKMLSTDISEWTISFIDTGMTPRSVSDCAA